ncbi:CMRF35-like molecule 8 [Cyprinodon tularosa]|uniref:CMRF35-like molecule 8 n=1 Tax=Cyprinodon tularosa TaxID=77115 RepID=UPI0018E1FC18|nr:CMRF35-like molecule 8 [Cyprinodon tularosa]
MRMFFITLWWLTASGSFPVVASNHGVTFNTACNNATVKKTAYIGETVSITCKYSQADESSIRKFCRHDGNFSCSNIISSRRSMQTRLSRFSLTDEGEQGVYEVNISMLTQEDSGRYWCALEGNTSITCLQVLFLHVLRHFYDNGDEGDAEDNDDDGAAVNDVKEEYPSKLSLIACIVSVVIVVAAIIVVILFRRKIFNMQGCCVSEEEAEDNEDVQNTERNDENHQYEEIQIQNKQENAVCTLYSTVNLPAEKLHYTSVNIHKDSSTENTNGSSILNGSLRDAGQTPAETTLYSIITNLGE